MPEGGQPAITLFNGLLGDVPRATAIAIFCPLRRLSRFAGYGTPFDGAYQTSTGFILCKVYPLISPISHHCLTYHAKCCKTNFWVLNISTKKNRLKCYNVGEFQHMVALRPSQ